jgi:GT2 family glycosyltransferase
MSDTAAAPYVRVVVLNYDGGEMTIDCVESLLATQWPADRLEVLVVDNGSVDGIADRLKAEYRRVRVLEPFANLGFAGGCNLGLRATGHFDYVALLNNDAVVEPDWLAPMVESVRSGDRIGAVAAKMVFHEKYHGITIEVPGADRPNRREVRRLGARLSAVRLDGKSIAAGRLVADEGFHAPEPPLPAEGEEIAWWTGKGGSLRVLAAGDAPTTMSVRLRAVKRQPVRIIGHGVTLDVVLDKHPRWFEVPIDPTPFDVIQNAGSGLFNESDGGDRGFLEPDTGQYDEPAEIFAWCGGAVLFNPDYLEEVGDFDDRLFLYYEDTDLSWRGRLAGWKYLYEPRAVVRHKHGQSSGLGSDLFRFYTERNRLLMLVKNAPAPVAARAVGIVVRDLLAHVKGNVVRPVLTLHKPNLTEIKRRVKVLRSFVALAPFMLADRRRAHLVRSRESLMAWSQTKDTA